MCGRFLEAGYQHSVSRLMFHNLFYGGCGRAALLRLCSRGTREDDTPLAHHRKTDDWIRHIVEDEFNPSKENISSAIIGL